MTDSAICQSPEAMLASSANAILSGATRKCVKPSGRQAFAGTTSPEAAFAEVAGGLEALLPRLWRFALMQCGDMATADDLVQAACLRALEKCAQFRAGSRLDSWLYTILVSIWRNELRAAGVRRGQGVMDVALIDLPASDADPEERAYLIDVLDAVAGLPQGQRAVVNLVCVEGFAYGEAARILDVPIGTVMSRLHTARRKLALALGGT